jgi:hypothetical protein
MLYSLLYVGDQNAIYLTEDQRSRIDKLSEAEGIPMAEVVRHVRPAWTVVWGNDVIPAKP